MPRTTRTCEQRGAPDDEGTEIAGVGSPSWRFAGATSNESPDDEATETAPRRGRSYESATASNESPDDEGTETRPCVEAQTPEV